MIAGIDATASVKELASKNTEVIEKFEDISDSIAMAEIMIAPMFMSIGLQNKILQAMAMKVPCITTSFANNAIGAPEGKAIIIADDTEKFIEEIINLINNKTHYNNVAIEGYKFVKNNFGWPDQNKKLENLITNEIC